MNNKEPDFNLKIVIVGDSGVGKTNILARFTKDKFFPDSKSTIGVEFATKSMTIEDKEVKATIWDTAGQDRYRAITSAYYRGANAVLLCYDITAILTFNNVKRWLDEAREHVDPGTLVLLVGNKCDLEELRAVPTEDGENLARQENMLFIETSAKIATNIDVAFKMAMTQLVKNFNTTPKMAEEDNPGINLKKPKQSVTVQETKSQKTTCC